MTRTPPAESENHETRIHHQYCPSQSETVGDLGQCQGQCYSTVETSIHCPVQTELPVDGTRAQCLIFAVWMITYSLTQQVNLILCLSNANNFM